MKNTLKRLFNVTQDLPGVFFDPDADMNDDLQKKAVEKQLSMLWKFTEAKDDFKLRTIEDISDKFDFCQGQTTALAKENSKLQTKIVSWS